MKKHFKLLGILGVALAITQFSTISVFANDENISCNKESYDEEIMPFDMYGNWTHVAESSYTGVVRLILAGRVTYNNKAKPISASNAYIKEQGGYGTDIKRIMSQSHTISSKGANYTVKVGTYDNTQPDGKYKSSKTYKFTKNPGPQ